MKKLILGGVGLAMLLAVPALAAEETPWIHVRVEEAKEQTKVSVNLPLSVVEVALEAAPEIIETHGDLHLGEEHKLHIETARKLWKELSAAGDAELVTVESEDENVKVMRKGDLVQVFVDKVGKEGEGDQEVRVEVPVSLVDAVLSGVGEEINLEAVAAELQKQRGNIVTVREKDTSVRVWIDEQNVSAE